MSLVAFPTEFPIEALPVLAAYLRKTKTVADAANAAWNVVGWAGGSFLPANPQPQQAAGAPPMSDAELADKLDDLHRHAQAAPPGAQQALFGGGAIWSLVGPLLIQVATRIINQWLGGGTGAPGTP